MTKIDTPTAYGSITRSLHWGMAACYLFMFSTAIAWNLNEDLMKRLIGAHKAVGMALLGLALLRFIWALIQLRHRPHNGLAAKAGHFALYGLMLAVPITAMIRQAGREQQNQAMIDIGNHWHGELAWVLLVLVAGHLAMTFWHHLKGEPILPRMLGRPS